jgi:magnesium transporter
MAHFELTREFLEELKDLIASKNNELAAKKISDLHAADIAEIYDELNIEQARFIHLTLEDEKGADVLVELEEDVRERFLENLPAETIAKQFIEQMDSDDAADIISELPQEIKEEVLSNLDDVEQAGDIVDLLNYPEDTAGGLMAKELVAVNLNWNILTSIRAIRKQAEEVDEIYNVYVIDDDDVLKGIISIKKLLLIPTSESISTIYDHEITSVKVDTPDEEVANIMDKYDLVSIPVVDSIGRLVGRITIDDVVDVIREEAEKDYQMASGISSDVEPSDKIWVLTKARIPWLLIGLFGGIISALVMGKYEGDIMKYAGLALFVPLINAMAGNVGVQSSAIVVQGLANNSLGLETLSKKLFKELAIGFTNGVICSTLIFVYNLFMSDSYSLTITVSIALFSVILFASVFGSFIPLMLNRFKVDPALATGPFITTINDIFGLFLYLFIGRIMFTIM